MGLVASTIPNLVSGVSQQPAPSRLRTSGERMVNAFPSIVSGLMKRPPSQFVAELTPTMTVSDNTAVHMIDRSVDEKYILVCGDSDLELYSDTGVKQTVTFPDGKSYLPATEMWKKLRFVTVADTTFILNTEKVTATNTITETRTNPRTRATVFIKNAIPSVAYAIYVNNVLAATYTTADNTTAATALEGTTEIAKQLKQDAVAKGYTDAEHYGPTLSFGITAGDTLTVTDEFGGRGMAVYTDTVQEFEWLPPHEEEGRLVKLQGNLDDGTASYWVEYKEGIWTETVGYDAQKELDASTMPHILVKTAPNTFEFRQNTWEKRKVGDEDSNPDPSFIGYTINGMFLFKGRLGILSEENLIMSASALFEDMYRTTVVQLLSSDPIDVASATGRVSTLYHGVSFSDELLLFSDKQQFRLSSGNVLTPETVGLTNSTSYPCSLYVPPVAVGSSAYFVADGATNTLAREVFIDAQRETVNGEDIAVQIPSYIPKNIRTVAASPTADVFLSLSADTPNELYVYKWYATGNKNLQAAWCKWVFDPNMSIVGMGFLDNHLYLVYKVGSDVRIDKINVAPMIDVDLLLDTQLVHTEFTSFTYDGVTDKTTIVLPFDHPSDFEFYKTDAEGNKNLQAAWCKWVFDPNMSIVGMGFLDNHLYLVYKVGSDVRIDKINVAPMIDVDLLLDTQLVHTEFTSFTYDGVTDKTTIVLPFDHPSDFEFYKTDAEAFEPYSDGGGVIKVDNSTYTIAGDVTGDQITAGLNYEFLYEFSKQYLREENSDGESAIQDGRLQLRYMSVIYMDSSYFEAHVTPTNGTTSSTVFNGRTLADPDNVTDLIPRDTGEFRFPVFAQNEEVVIELKNDQPYRCAFGSVEWSAMYRAKARRVQ